MTLPMSLMLAAPVVLIAAAMACQADLLVTGAFGEPADGSILGLGRATRKIATGAQIPVLMQN